MLRKKVQGLLPINKYQTAKYMEMNDALFRIPFICYIGPRYIGISMLLAYLLIYEMFKIYKFSIKNT